MAAEQVEVVQPGQSRERRDVGHLHGAVEVEVLEAREAGQGAQIGDLAALAEVEVGQTGRVPHGADVADADAAVQVEPGQPAELGERRDVLDAEAADDEDAEARQLGQRGEVGQRVGTGSLADLEEPQALEPGERRDVGQPIAAVELQHLQLRQPGDRAQVGDVVAAEHQRFEPGELGEGREVGDALVAGDLEGLEGPESADELEVVHRAGRQGVVAAGGQWRNVLDAALLDAPDRQGAGAPLHRRAQLGPPGPRAHADAQQRALLAVLEREDAGFVPLEPQLVLALEDVWHPQPAARRAQEPLAGHDVEVLLAPGRREDLDARPTGQSVVGGRGPRR